MCIISITPAPLVTHQVGVLGVICAHVSLQLAEAGEALAAVAGDVGGAGAGPRAWALEAGGEAGQAGELGEGGAEEAGHTWNRRVLASEEVF